MSSTELFLIAMVLIFSVPYLIWRIFRTDHYAPLVAVQIGVGILLGPGILGALFPNYYAFVFTPGVIQALNGIAWWAVMIFVCIAGIELDLRATWANRWESGITAALALGVPLLSAAWSRPDCRSSPVGSGLRPRASNSSSGLAWRVR
jgi:K+:H+ antiporter